MEWIRVFCIISLIAQLTIAGGFTDTFGGSDPYTNPDGDNWTEQKDNVNKDWTESGGYLNFRPAGLTNVELHLINDYAAGDSGELVFNINNSENTPEGTKGGVLFRWTGTSSFYYLYTEESGDDSLRIGILEDVIATSGGTLFSADSTLIPGWNPSTDPIEIRLVIRADSVEIYANGYQMGTFSDPTHTSGQVGIGMPSGTFSSDVKIADFTWTDFTAPPTVSTPISDTTITEDASAIKYRDLHTVFDDPEDSASLTFSVATNDSTLLTPSIDGSGDTLIITTQNDSNGTADIYVTASDGAGTVSDTFTVTVSAVNDLPTSANDTVTTDEDLNYTFSGTDFPFADVESGTISGIEIFTAENNGDLEYNGIDVVNGTIVSDFTKLVFKPDADSSGNPYALFTFKVYDGTSYSSSSYIMTIIVNSVNDAPTAANNSDGFSEDNDYTFAYADLNYSDIDGDAMTNIEISTSVVAGTLYNDANLDGNIDGGESLADAATVSKTDIDAGKLKYRPALNGNGIPYDSLLFKVNDGTTYSASSYTFRLNVLAVNDTPTVAVAISDTTVTEDFSPINYRDLNAVFTDIESGSALTFTATSLQSKVTPSVNGADSVLILTAVANENGIDTVVVTASDGTLEVKDSVIISITAQNDAPTVAVAISDTTVPEDFSPINYRDLNSVFTDVEDGSALTFSVTSLQSKVTPSINGADSVLILTAVANENGIDTVVVTASDGALQVKDSAVITITAQNDAPTASSNTVSGKVTDDLIFSSGDFNFSDIDAGDALVQIQITGLESVGVLYLDANGNGNNDAEDVTINQVIALTDISKLTFEASGYGTSYDSFTFKVHDGDAYSASSYTMTIDIADAYIVKDNNTTALNIASSWVDGVVPTAVDTAVWNNTVTGINSVSLGADATWAQIRIENPGGTVTISNNTLTLGAGGIDMTSATMNLTLASNVVISSDQTWNNGENIWVSGTLSGTGNLTKDGTANLTLATSNTFTGTVTVNNGRVYVKNSNALGTTGSATTVTSGGSLTYTSNVTVGEPITLNGNGYFGLGALNSESGVNTHSGTIALGSTTRLGASADTLKISGVISGAETIEKTGNGTIKLQGNNTHSSNLLLNAGSLFLNGTNVSQTSISVAAGTKLGGTGSTAASVSMVGASYLEPGDGSAAKLSTGALTMSSTCTLSVDIGTTSDTVAITGDLTLDGTINIASGAGFGVGTYTIMTYTGTLTNNTLEIGSNPGTYSYSISTDADEVFLHVNNPPTASNNTVTATEDTDFTFSASDFGFSDVDGGDALVSVEITGLESVGILYLDANGNNSNDAEDITINQIIALADISKITFEAQPDSNGTSYDSFTFKVSDGKDYSASSSTMTIDVTADNDAPTVAVAIADTTVLEDFNPVNYRDLNSVFTDVENGSALTFTVASLQSKVTPSVNGADSVLVLTAVLNENGVDTVVVTASDGALEVKDSVVITITPQNDAPTVAAAISDTTVIEDFSPINYRDLNTVFTDVENGSALTFTVSSLQSKVTPSVNGADSVLVLTAVLNENGVDTIVVTASDGALEVKDSVIITIAAQNDTPTIAAALVDLTVPEDSGNVNHVDLNTVFTDVEDGSAMTFAATSFNTNVVTVSINGADSMLVLAFPSDSNGVTNIEVTATDAGGIVVKDTMQVTVTAVNDEPISADTTVGTAINVLRTFGTIDFPYSDVEGSPIDSIQITTLESVGELFFDANGNDVNDAEDVGINDVIAIADIAMLKFLPETDSSGTPYATFGFKVHDGTDFSVVPYTMTINVSPNTLPAASDTSVTILEDNDYVVDTADFRFSDIDAGAMFNRIVVETIPANGILFVDNNLDGIVDGGETVANSDPVLVGDMNAGKLKFRPAADSNGTTYDTFVFRVHDGIQAAAGTNTFTINVTAVNDEPTFTVGSNITVNEDTGAVTKSGWIADGSAGPANESAQTLTYNVTNDDSTLFSVQPAVDASGNLTFTTANNSNGSATVTVVLSDNGGTANSGDDTSPAQNFTITVNAVNDVPVISSITDTTINEDGTTGARSFTVSDIESDTTALTTYWLSSNSDLVDSSEVTIGGTSGTPTITIAPKADSSGSALITLGVTDGTDTTVETFTLTVSPVNDTPVVTSAILDTATEDIAYEFVGTGTDKENVPTISFANLPSWLTASNDTVSGTPLNGDSDTSFKVIATDGSLSDTQVVTVTVTAVNDAPVITSATSANATEDILFSYTATATDPDNTPTITFEYTPSWMSVTGDTIKGTPTEGISDTSFKVIATDGLLSDTQLVTVTVTAVNDAPVITSASSANATEDVLFSYTATATDPDNTPTISFENTPLWMSFTGDTIKGTPTEGISDTSFKVIATDGSLSDTQVVTVTVTAVNDAPVITSISSANATEDILFSYIATATDPDNTPTISFEKVPSWMTVTADTIKGTPTEGVTDTTFTVIATDGFLSDTQIVTLTVTAVNDAPVITSASSANATEDILFSYTASAADPDDIPVINFVNLPNWLKASGTTISGTPQNGDVDTSFTVIASDGTLVDTLDVTVMITATNDAPIVIVQLSDVTIYDTTSDTAIVAISSLFSDPDADPLSYAVSSTGIVDVSILLGTLTISAQSGKVGIDTIVVQAKDPSNEAALDSIFVTVLQSNQPPVLIKPIEDIVVDEDFPGTITIDLSTIFTDYDPNDQLLFSYANSGSVIEIDINDNDVIIKSMMNSHGTDEIIVSATDKSNAQISDTFSIMVNEINDNPEIIAPEQDTTGVEGIYQKQFEAVDPDEDDLYWELISAPTGMTISQDGLLEWQPERSDIGFHTIYITVADEENSIDTISYTITVLRDYVSLVNEPVTNKSSVHIFPSVMTEEHDEIQIVLHEKHVQSATVKIFDAVGNMLFESECYENGDHFMTVWDGRNRNGRKSSGTFLVLCIIQYDDQSRSIQKALLGISQ